MTGATYQHVIVLFTDGLNTGDRWYGDFSFKARKSTRDEVVSDARIAAQWSQIVNMRTISDNGEMLGHFSRRCMVTFGGAVLLAGCVQPRGLSYIEPARPGESYDFAVHVRNTPDIGYNPEVDEDRIRLARRIVKPHCASSQVAGKAKLNTEIWGITSSLPDYVVYLKCL